MEIFTIYDKVAEECGPPFAAQNIEVAKRMYRRAMKEPDVNPYEFALFHSGSISKSGELTAFPSPDDIYVDLEAIAAQERSEQKMAEKEYLARKKNG